MNEQATKDATNILKCGKRTYFFDLREAKNGSTYLRITESQFLGEGTERRRNSFILFKDDIQGFVSKIESFEKDLKNSPQSRQKKEE